MSATEKYLRNQTASIFIAHNPSGRNTDKQSSLSEPEQYKGFSLFDLKAQIQMIKIYTTFCSSLMNLVLQDKEMMGGHNQGLVGDNYHSRQ